MNVALFEDKAILSCIKKGSLTVLSIPFIIFCPSSPLYDEFVLDVSSTSVLLEEDSESEPSMIVPIRVMY